MNREEKIKYYYERLLYVLNKSPYFDDITFIGKNSSIVNVISKIVNLNNDYLLTDGYMYYVIKKSACTNYNVFKKNLLDNLSILVRNNREELAIEMSYYFSSTRIDYELQKFLNDKEKKLLEEENASVSKSCRLHDWISDKRNGVIETHLLIAYAGKTILDQTFDDYKDIADAIATNPNSLLDELQFKGIYKETDYMTDHGPEIIFKAEDLIIYILYRSNPKMIIN